MRHDGENKTGSKNVDDVSPAPWHRYDWSGELISSDGTSTADFTRDDVAEVIAFATTDSDWDGNTAAIVRLKDGRFIGWEASYGPTGNGFVCDAYGGDADIIFGATIAAVRQYLSENARAMLDKAGCPS